PQFSWNAVPNAASYSLVVVDHLGSTAMSATVSGTTFTPSAAQALTPGQSYTWYLGAVTSGTTTYVSRPGFSIAALTAPTPSGPSGAIAASAGYDKPTFSWSSVTGANHYALVVIDNTAGNSLALVNTNVGNGTSFTPSTALTPGHSYTWYI